MDPAEIEAQFKKKDDDDDEDNKSQLKVKRASLESNNGDAPGKETKLWMILKAD